MMSRARHIAPISASGCAIVVEVSPCTTARMRGWCFLIASSIWSGVNTVPHSHPMVATLPPQRCAISVSRWPKRPKIGTSTLSPGAISDTRMASMPARAVPSTTSDHLLLVR